MLSANSLEESILWLTSTICLGTTMKAKTCT